MYQSARGGYNPVYTKFPSELGLRGTFFLSREVVTTNHHRPVCILWAHPCHSHPRRDCHIKTVIIWNLISLVPTRH